jgi:predicted component of type VI protein secretion system
MNVRALLIVIFLIVLSGCDQSSSGAEEMIGIFPKKSIDMALNYSREQNGNALLIWQDGE